MENKEFSKKLESRTRKFAINIIKLSTLLPNTAESRVIKYQITKSGTSIGANYREANHSRSKADFSSKIRICESEVSATGYRLELVTNLGYIDSEEIKTILIEAKEILAILTSISKSLRIA